MNTCDKSMRPAVSTREFLFPLIVCAVIIAYGTLPYLYGYARQTPQERFMGFVGRGVSANNSYLMWARQAYDGLNLFENKLTPEPLPRVYFNPEWWVFGKTARWTGLPLLGVFHLYRMASVFALVFALYWIASLCHTTILQRRLVVLTGVFGVGFGWIPWLVSEVYVRFFPAIQPFLSAWNLPGAHLTVHPFVPLRDVQGVTVFGYLTNIPHFMMGTAFITLTYGFLILGEYTGERRHFAWSGVCAVIQTLIRPYALIEIYCVYALSLLLTRGNGPLDMRRITNYATPACILSISVFYYLYLSFTQVLGMAGWERKGGHFFEYILWYGLPFLVLVVYLLLQLLRLQRPFHPQGAAHPMQIVLLWMVVSFLSAQMYPYLVYAEESAALTFFVAPAIVIAGEPLERLYQWLTRLFPNRLSGGRNKALLAAVFVLLCAPTCAVVYARFFTALQRYPQDYYLNTNVLAAMEWLDRNTDHADVVMGDLCTCVFVPRVSGHKTYSGQDMITANYFDKNHGLERFLNSRGDDAFKQQLVRENRVRYLIYGPQERRATGMRPMEHAWLQPVFTRDTVTVYKIALK